MARELRPIDISNQPEVLRIAEEVRATQEPRVLRRNREDLAIVTPIRRARSSPSRAKPLRRDDSLFNIVGIAASEEGEPTDVSSNKHRYLAEAYAKQQG